VKKLKPFNVSNITSYNNLQELFSLLDNKINSQLIQRIGKLISLIKQQKQKIIEAYLHFAPEKELLRELITIHLAYNRVNMTKEENDEETIKL
jgi:hypothetical protein